MLELPYIYEFIGSSCSSTSLDTVLTVEDTCQAVSSSSGLHYEWKLISGCETQLDICGMRSHCFCHNS